MLQSISVIPLIHQAELYENVAEGQASLHNGHMQEAGSPEWQPAEGAERLVFTWLANACIAAGFALMMTGVMAIRPPKTSAQSLIYGLCGYYVFFVAPALLLPPELPGAESSDLGVRQASWLITVILSCSGMALLVSARFWWVRVLALLVLSAPFMWLDAHPSMYSSAVPHPLIAQFAWMTGVTNLVFWLFLGIVVYLLSRKLTGHSLSEVV